MLICLFVVAPIIGIVIEAAVMRRLEGVSEATKLVVMLAIALMLLGIAQWIWKPTTYRALLPLFHSGTLVAGINSYLIQRRHRIDHGAYLRSPSAPVSISDSDGRHYASQAWRTER